MGLVLRQLGRRLVVPVRPQRAARRPCGVRRHRPLKRSLHRDLHCARDHAGHSNTAAGTRGRDVQPGRAGAKRRRHLHCDPAGSVTRRKRVLAVVGVTLAAGVFAVGAWVALPLPGALLSPPQVASLTLEDRNGLVLRSTRAGDGSLQRWISLGEIDPDLLEAFVAGEDHRFYDHHGVDLRAVGRAITENMHARRVRSGASTITMQLARLLRPGGSRTWRGKVLQAFWALRLEAHLSKQQILEQYLNRVPLGQGTIGVDAAAVLYFNATAARLSLGQAALLAGLASAPSTDTPSVAPDRARSRRALVLGRIGRYGYATADALDCASREPLVAPRSSPPFLAPHFTSRVLQWMDSTTGGTGGTGGGIWRTSLDLPLQTALEAEVRHTVRSLADRGARGRCQGPDSARCRAAPRFTGSGWRSVMAT